MTKTNLTVEQTPNELLTSMNTPKFIQFLKEHANTLLEMFSSDSECQSEMTFEEFAFETYIEIGI